MIVKYVYFVTTCDDGDSNPVTFPMTEKEFKRMFNGGAFCEYSQMGFEKVDHRENEDGSITVYAHVLIDWTYSQLKELTTLPKRFRNLTA